MILTGERDSRKRFDFTYKSKSRAYSELCPRYSLWTGWFVKRYVEMCYSVFVFALTSDTETTLSYVSVLFIIVG